MFCTPVEAERGFWLTPLAIPGLIYDNKGV